MFGWNDQQQPRATPWTRRHWLVAGVAASVALSSLWLAWNIWLLRLPQFSFHALFQYDWHGSLGLTAFVGACAIWLGKPTRRSFSLRQMLAAVLLVSITFGAGAWIRERQPLRFCFWLSQSSLDRFADHIVEEGFDPANSNSIAPTVGAYQISSAYVINNAVVLRLDDRGSSPAFRYAFVRIPHRTGQKIATAEFGFPEVYTRSMHLSGDWFVFYDRYESIKVGWS